MNYIITTLSIIALSTISCDMRDSSANPNKITNINSDLNLYDDKTYIIDADISNISGNINLGGKTTLIIENSRMNFELVEDLQYGIYLEDDAKIIIKGSTLESANKMWEFELRNNSTIDVSNSSLKNHSAVKLFDNCVLNGTNSLIEELRMDNQGIAIINNCEIYPNMQFFFNVAAPLEFPDSYTPVDLLIDNISNGGWKLNMTNSTAQGWQVDVKPNTDITIQNSIDVTLALWSNGNVNDSINLVNPSGVPVNFTVTELGSAVNVVNTEVYFLNLYLSGNDKLVISGEKTISVYNTKFLEVLLVSKAQLAIYNSHIFGQLFHINDESKVIIYNCLVGSDDPDDPINSEFAIKNNSSAFAVDCDMTNTDIVIKGTSKLELTNCTYDSNRVFISDDGELIIH